MKAVLIFLIMVPPDGMDFRRNAAAVVAAKMLRWSGKLLLMG
jgi:hypothetical protein